MSKTKQTITIQSNSYIINQLTNNQQSSKSQSVPATPKQTINITNTIQNQTNKSPTTQNQTTQPNTK